MMIWLHNYLDISIFAVLGVMSVLALAFAVERFLSYRRLGVEQFTSLEALQIQLQKGLPVIATVASSAPYVGLLGTVFGIMLTFHDIGQSGQIDTRTVMVGLALALKATALGLFVAIPSMMVYNLLVARAERLQLEWKLAHQERGNEIV